MKDVLILGFGGFFGTISRYYTQQIFSKFTNFPFGTFVVNIVGCLLIGFLYGILLNSFFPNISISNNHLKMFFITGFCGGFTTFSSFAYEGIDLFNRGYCLNSLLYITLSVFLGIIFCYLGIYISKLIF